MLKFIQMVSYDISVIDTASVGFDGIFTNPYLDHCSLVTPYGDAYLLVNIGSSNGMLP